MVELEGLRLTLSVQTATDAEFGIEILQAALGDLVGEPKVTRERLDDILSDPDYTDLFAADDDVEDEDEAGEARAAANVANDG